MNISVAMTTCNGGKFLAKQINSILVQTLPVNEIIVCDDASVDETVSLLKNFKENGILRVYENSHKLGVTSNFKKAVSLTKKENWVALSDQDDIWLPQKLEKTASALASINDEDMPCIVYTDLTLVDMNGQILKKSFRSVFGHNGYKHNLNSLLYNNFANGCTVLMNCKAKEWFADIPDDIRYYDEWLALMAYAFGKAYYLAEPTVFYRQHNSNVTISEKIAEKKLVWRLYALFSQLKKVILGKDDFLVEQIEAIAAFYEHYKDQLAPDKRLVFKKFLGLKNKSYFKKKLAYRNMVGNN